MKTLLLIAILLTLSQQGCIPLVIGGYIGYQMSQKDDHDQWCNQHVGDPTCHP